MISKTALKIFFLALLVSSVSFFPNSAAAYYTNNRLMDDAIFDNVNSMSEQAIRDFINSRPSSCLAVSGSIFPEPQNYFDYGPNNVDAARVIYRAAQAWGLNPQVIITTLQKEQSLITRTNCYESNGIDSRNKAMGMGCPDSGPCPAPQYAGLHQQVMKGSWQLKFNKERAVGNVMWNSAEGDQYIFYPGPYTAGNRKNNVDSPAVYRDGYWPIDGQNVYMETGATASLYRYTPHLGQSFPSIFEGWFGSPALGCPTNATPWAEIMRAYHPGTYKHFWSGYVCEINTLQGLHGYHYEGIAFYQTSASSPYAVVVHRLYNPVTQLHLWSTTQGEINLATQQLGYRYEGVAFNVVRPEVPGHVVVHRLYNPTTYQHLWATTQADINSATQFSGYRYEGVAFYGAPPPAQ